MEERHMRLTYVWTRVILVLSVTCTSVVFIGRANSTALLAMANTRMQSGMRPVHVVPRVIPISAVDIISQQISYGGTLDSSRTLQGNRVSGDSLFFKGTPQPTMRTPPAPLTAPNYS